MSELISTAPLYTKTRVHRTKIGNILCTGKGCIGCDRKYQSDEQNFAEILGEVDSVDFNKQEPRFLSSSEVRDHENRARRHGNKISTWTAGANTKTKKDKFRRKTKCGAEKVNITDNSPRTDSLHKKNNKSDSLAIHDGKRVSNNHFEGNLKTAAKIKLKTQSKNKTVSFAAPLIRQGTFTLGEERRKSEIGDARSQKDEPKSAQLTGNKHARSRTYPFIAERKTNFLKMLQSSSGGIFDIETMRNKKSSKWVKEALKSGAREDQIFPRIHNKEQKSNFMKTTAKKSSGKRRTLTTEDENETQKNERLLPNVPRRDGFPREERNSVLVIEHPHQKANAKDDSLHKLGFRAQQGPRCTSFPKVSILEIAENLDDLVQLGAVKLIQEYEGRWYILVSSRIIRNFLIQRGVTLRGRSFELIDFNEAE